MEKRTLLNVWIGQRDMPPLYRQCVQSQRRAFPDYSYELIDNQKALSLLTAANDLYEGANTIEDFKRVPFITPDYLRCFFLSLKPYTLYCDCDVFFESDGFSHLDEKTPAMERISHTGIYNSGIIWNACATTIFDAMCHYWFRQQGVQFINGSMNHYAMENSFQPLESGFTHYMVGCWFGYDEKKIFDEEAVPQRLLSKGFAS